MNYDKPKFFDLQKAITTDVNFSNRIQKLMHDLTLAEASKDTEAVKHLTLEILRTCDYNASLLVPFFFPKFAGNKPMTLWSRPHAFSMMAVGAGNIYTIQASRQIGKCLSGKTKLRCKTQNTEEEITIEDLFNEAKDQACTCRSQARTEAPLSE